MTPEDRIVPEDNDKKNEKKASDNNPLPESQGRRNALKSTGYDSRFRSFGVWCIQKTKIYQNTQ